MRNYQHRSVDNSLLDVITNNLYYKYEDNKLCEDSIQDTNAILDTCTSDGDLGFHHIWNTKSKTGYSTLCKCP